MAGVPIKFRCFQCNQLLGVSRSKVGSVVACPKCAAELIVPEPDEAITAAQPSTPEMPVAIGQPSPPETTEAFLSALAADLPVEIADIRPEDIRVEPSIAWSPPRQAPPASQLPPFVPPPAPPPEVRVPAPFPVAPEPLAAPVTPHVPISLSRLEEPVVPSIKVDPPSLASERTTVRARDLVLPRSVVASWSLFVLLAQGLAFVAGLLAGHYIWRVH